MNGRDRDRDDEGSMRPDRGDSDPLGLKRRGGGRRRACRFCVERDQTLDYKDVATLRHFISDRGKIVPRRISGNCAYHQRQVTTAIKRARNVALVPYTAPG